MLKLSKGDKNWSKDWSEALQAEVRPWRVRSSTELSSQKGDSPGGLWICRYTENTNLCSLEKELPSASLLSLANTWHLKLSVEEGRGFSVSQSDGQGQTGVIPRENKILCLSLAVMTEWKKR